MRQGHLRHLRHVLASKHYNAEAGSLRQFFSRLHSRVGDGAQVTTETPVRMELHLDPTASGHLEEFALYHGELIGFSDISYYERGVYTVTESVTALVIQFLFKQVF